MAAEHIYIVEKPLMQIIEGIRELRKNNTKDLKELLTQGKITNSEEKGSYINRSRIKYSVLYY